MKKALRIRARLFLVAGVSEISNLKLLKDLAEVVDFIELKTHLHKILNQKESEIQLH
jgi:hypothetical protein